jgi:aminoglycoside/choline kinase family phosphotransferase
LDKINLLLKDWNISFDEIIKIPASGSQRVNYIIFSKDAKFVLTLSDDVSENETFFYFSLLLKENHVRCPEVLKISTDKKAYLQSFVGKESLLEVLFNKKNKASQVFELYKKTLDALFSFQHISTVDYSKCYDFTSFDEKLILQDLFYFKNYFVDVLEINYKKSSLLNEFYEFSKQYAKLNPKGLMFRDFQARNIMVSRNEVYFIDYQGAMFGNVVYDLISLIHQAKANLSNEWKEELKKYYFSKLQNELNYCLEELENSYSYGMIIRMLQVLGAYGFRGLIQKKSHFLESIKFGQENLNQLVATNLVLKNFPTLRHVIEECSKVKIFID